MTTLTSWFTRTPAPVAPGTTPDDRRALVEQRAAARAEYATESVRLQAAYEQAQATVGALERELTHAHHLADVAQRERLAASMMHDLRDARLARRLRDSAPSAIEQLLRDVRALADAARGKAETRVADGYETVTGHRPPRVSTNRAEVAAVLEAARQLDVALERMLYEAAPDVDRFAPFAEIRLDATRRVRVPTTLAARGIAGVSATTPTLITDHVRILKDLMPSMSRLAILWDQSDPGSLRAFNEAVAGAKAAGVLPHGVEARNAAQLRSAFGAAASGGGECVDRHRVSRQHQPCNDGGRARRAAPPSRDVFAP
jgi:hypothetical protein